MNFNRLVITGMIILILLYSCTTDPDIDYEKITGVYLITCKLRDYEPGTGTLPPMVTVSRIRYLVDLAFDSGESQDFGIEGADVSISGPDSIYHFMYSGGGVYEYPHRLAITPGSIYRLDVVLPDCSIAASEIFAPMLDIEQAKDTIWIKPDSVTAWFENEWGSRRPLNVTGSHFADTVNFSVTPGSRLNYLPASYASGHEWNTDSSWFEVDTTVSSLIFRSAADRPGSLGCRTVDLRLRVNHEAEIELDRITSLDDYSPMENLEEISNIDGAYGVFTCGSYWYFHRVVLAPVGLKE